MSTATFDIQRETGHGRRAVEASVGRRAIYTTWEGERLEGGLPGVNASAADIAFAVATAWHKHRHVGRSLMERMIADRPRRASDIRRVFEQFGVH